MIYAEISAEAGKYDVIYSVNRSSLPMADNGVWIVGRTDKNCDSLVDLIARDVKERRFELIIGKGFANEDKKRIREYLEKKRNGH